MADFESGVAKYIVATTEVRVHFPVDFKGREEIACKHCQFYKRPQQCGLNGEVVNFPEHFVGYNCPLKLVEEGEEENA